MSAPNSPLENVRMVVNTDFASQLVMKGIDLNTVRVLTGHAYMKMTMRYAHLAPSSKLRAVEVLAENAMEVSA